MAIRIKRQTNLLHDNTSGTVNIVHGSPRGNQSGGFFGRSFTNTGSSSRKRRRKRLHARAQQLAAQAHAEAQARAQAEAEALAQRQANEQAAAHARAEAQAQAQAQAAAAERARIEAAARAELEKAHAHRSIIETLSSAYPTMRSDLERSYLDATRSLSVNVLHEIESGLGQHLDNPTGQQLQDLILQEKAQINRLLASKQAALESRQHAVRSFPHQNTLESSPEQYRRYLETQSQGNTSRVTAIHDSWMTASRNEYEAKLLGDAIALLDKKNTALSMRHAELSVADQVSENEIESGKYPNDVNIKSLWSAVSPTLNVPATSLGQSEALTIAKKYFLEAAVKRLGRNLGVVLATFPRQLGDAEMLHSAIATPLSQLNLPAHLDLEYVATTKGTIDVPYRLTPDAQNPAWVAADGVKIGTKVRVRTFTYNRQNNTYEFIRDGESIPALIWTPTTHPANSSTITPVRPPSLPGDPGVSVAPIAPEVEVYPAIDTADPDDYILISPPGSGLPDTYLLFKDPRSVPGIASGYGKHVDGIWLHDGIGREGAPIPSRIADKLRGRNFSSFDRMREALWKEVSKDPELSKQLGKLNLKELANGNAPFAPEMDRLGMRVKYEIHHREYIKDGGAVYDIENLIILAPKHHIQTHRKNT